jgi:hypothetical protein
MNFFIMKPTADSTIIGKYPQLEKMFDGFHGFYRYEAWGLQSDRRQTPMEHLAGFKLYYHAKVTDMVSAAQFGIDAGLFSSRFYDLLQKFDCMEMISVDSEVFHHNKKYPYKFIYFPQTHNQFIDFERSRIYLHRSGWIGDVTVKNYEEFSNYLQELDELNRILIEKKEYSQTRMMSFLELYLDEKKATKDFFRLARIAGHWIVSARLKEAIEAAGMTGMKFISAQGHKTPTLDTTVDPPREVI